MSEDKTYTKAELEAAIAEAKDAQDVKNRELLSEVKTLRTELRKVKDVSPDDLAAVEAERDELRTKLVAADKAAKDAAKTAETATKALEAESGFTRKLLVENGLREQLAANGVTNPIHQKAAMAMLASGVEITADGTDRAAKVGDKALAEFVKEWAGGEEGKHFVTAAVNSGGGAPGGKAGGDAKTITRPQFDAMDHAARSEFSKGGGQVVDQAA